MKTIRILAFFAAALAYSSAFAAISTWNTSPGGLWITIYDVSQNKQFDYGCVSPKGYRQWTNSIYGNSFGASAFVVRAELTPDAACKQPKVCDTTMTVNGKAEVSLRTKTDSYGKAVLAKCWLRAGPQTVEEYNRDVAEATANLKECRARTMTIFNATSQTLAKVTAYGKAPKTLLMDINHDFEPIKTVMTAPLNDNPKLRFPFCPPADAKLREMLLRLGPYMPPGSR